jgi:hypothetical protein
MKKVLSPDAEMAQRRATPTTGLGGDTDLIPVCSPGQPEGACQISNLKPKSVKSYYVLKISFLGASKRLYNSLRWSVGPLVGWSRLEQTHLTTRQCLVKNLKCLVKELGSQTIWSGVLIRFAVKFPPNFV